MYSTSRIKLLSAQEIEDIYAMPKFNKAEVDKALGIAGLYAFAKDFLPGLKISKNAIRYYADLAEQYAASRLGRLSRPQQSLQAL